MSSPLRRKEGRQPRCWVAPEALAARFFEGERPSDTRLVQIWMSKQRPAEKWMPKSWQILAKGLYYTMLRQAAKIAGIGVHTYKSV
jgi:hypothetical protein